LYFGKQDNFAAQDFKKKYFASFKFLVILLNNPTLAMARETLSPASNEEKPLPTPRPGTSGTENLLVTNRRRASENYAKAQRAEQAYRTKKRAATARRDYHGAREHFSESFKHFKAGMRMSFTVVKSAPYILGERREQSLAKAEVKKKEKALERKKKLEEKLARESADGVPAGDEAEATPATTS
jgi:hypothetical protein